MPVPPNRKSAPLGSRRPPARWRVRGIVQRPVARPGEQRVVPRAAFHPVVAELQRRLDRPATVHGKQHWRPRSSLPSPPSMWSHPAHRTGRPIRNPRRARLPRRGRPGIVAGRPLTLVVAGAPEGVDVSRPAAAACQARHPQRAGRLLPHHRACSRRAAIRLPGARRFRGAGSGRHAGSAPGPRRAIIAGGPADEVVSGPAGEGVVTRARAKVAVRGDSTVI